MNSLSEEMIWDSKDDYFNSYFTIKKIEYEVVIRSFEKSYSIQIENLKYNNIILEETYESYDELNLSIMTNCHITSIDSIPSEAQLYNCELQCKQLGDIDEESEDYEICAECHDPDCIEEIGGCN